MAEFLGLGRPIRGQHFLRAKDTNLTLLNWKLVSELKTLPHCDQNQGSRSKEQVKACLCHAEVIGPQAVSSVKRVNIAVGLSTLFFTRWARSWPESGNLRLKKVTFPQKWGFLRSFSWSIALWCVSAKPDTQGPSCHQPLPPSAL